MHAKLVRQARDGLDRMEDDLLDTEETWVGRQTAEPTGIDAYGRIDTYKRKKAGGPAAEPSPRKTPREGGLGYNGGNTPRRNVLGNLPARRDDDFVAAPCFRCNEPMHKMTLSCTVMSHTTHVASAVAESGEECYVSSKGGCNMGMTTISPPDVGKDGDEWLNFKLQAGYEYPKGGE